MSEGAPTTSPAPSLADELRLLMLRPATFFASLDQRQLAGAWAIAALAVGISSGIDQIENRNLLGDFVASRAQPAANEATWADYWRRILVFGVVAAAPYYWIFGSVTGLFTRFSGARPDWALLRRITAIAQGPGAIGTLAWVCFETVRYPTPAAAYESLEYLELSLVGLAVWSLFLLYRGVCATHPVRPGRARFWFIGLPLVVIAAILLTAFGVSFSSQF